MTDLGAEEDGHKEGKSIGRISPRGENEIPGSPSIRSLGLL